LIVTKPGVTSMSTSSGMTAGKGATITRASPASYMLTGNAWGSTVASMISVASVTCT
jgi:hypothetical protein